MTKEKQQKIINIILLFILLQPFFDIISFLSIRGLIPFNISTYVKPLFVFSVGAYMLFIYSPIKKNWFTYIIFFGLFLLGHFYILYKLFVPLSTMLHEFRYVLNIIYMILLFIIMQTLYYHYDDKEELLTKIKNTVTITMIIYGTLLILAVLTGTSGMTYEYSDKNKLGYKGWFDSGQILGHAISVLFPITLYNILRPTKKWYIKVINLLIIIITVSLLGTKVPYYITFAVLVIYLIISLGIKIFNKEFKRNYFNIITVTIFLLFMIISYKYTPVSYNTELNRQNAGVNINSYDIKSIDGSKNVKSLDELISENKNNDVSRLIQYKEWNIKASNYLVKLYETGKVHPSNIRSKQFYYSYKKFQLSTIEYKIFGIGYLNQDDGLSIESDFLMALFCFGILGFLLILAIPIYEFISSTVFILKNTKKVDLETYMLYAGLGIFFCTSLYAGYTYIYTNFSIYLVMLIIMLKTKINIIKSNIKKRRENKSIDFLLLHLGYGGIESATINSANALCDKYDVRIVSFYKLENNQEDKLDKRIKIKYICNTGPNRDAFNRELSNHNIIGILKEGIKAVIILVRKKVSIIYYIRKTKSDVIVSTRVEFNYLLSKYGKYKTLKIAQEHHHHNNNKKYIKILSRKYYNIDYLCALTKSLEKDYNEFLKNNNHTKVVLLPNMLIDIPEEKSKLTEKNIITVSRLDEGKKNDDIIRSFSKLKENDWKLYIIGDGKEYNNLSNLINELKLEDRVILTGYKDKKEIEDYMLKSSIFLMASVSEGLPMVLLEAMSYGLPCIAYETASGTSDIIQNEKNGYIIKNRNEKQYIEKIEKLIKNDKLRKELGLNAKKSIDNFSKKRILTIWEKILKME